MLEIIDDLGPAKRQKICHPLECHELSSDSIPAVDKQRTASLRDSLIAQSQYRGYAEIRPVQMFARSQMYACVDYCIGQ